MRKKEENGVNPEDLENRKSEVEDVQGPSKNLGEESVSPLSRLIRGIHYKISIIIRDPSLG